jgi:chromosome segregation ATPase
MLVRKVIPSLFVLGLLTGYAYAQETATARAARLRAELANVQAQHAELEARLAQINEDIKPENIERSLAGVGSTRPEELREARRRQFDIQRKAIQAQLESLTATRTRLESAIASADAESYRQTVGPTTPSISNSRTSPSKQSHRQKPRVKKQRLDVAPTIPNI